MQHNSNDFFTMLWIMICSYFAAFCKEINDKAHNTEETVFMVISEILLHGLSGTIIGVYVSYQTDSVALITCAAAVGGMFGYNLLRLLLKYVVAYGAATKNISINMDDLDKLDEEE